MPSRTSTRALVAIVAATYCRGNTAAPAHGAEFPAEYQDSVVQSILSIGCPGGGFATGFVIGIDDHGAALVLTAHHVIAPDEQFSGAVDFYPHGTFDPIQSWEILACSVSEDLALLRIVTGATPPVLPLADPGDVPVEAGCPALTVGFPAGQLRALCTSIVGTTDVSCPDGGHIWSWQLADPVQGGASGSPLIAKVGEAYRVIGVIRASDERNAYAVVSVPAFVETYAPPLAPGGDVRLVIGANNNAFTRDLHVLNMQLRHLVR